MGPPSRLRWESWPCPDERILFGGEPLGLKKGGQNDHFNELA